MGLVDPQESNATNQSENQSVTDDQQPQKDEIKAQKLGDVLNCLSRIYDISNYECLPICKNAASFQILKNLYQGSYKVA